MCTWCVYYPHMMTSTDHRRLLIWVLGSCAEMMKKLRTDQGAIKFVLSGANIMCPGLTHPDAVMHDEVSRHMHMLYEERPGSCLGHFPHTQANHALPNCAWSLGLSPRSAT